MPDLDAFVNAVANKRDRDPVRLKAVQWNGATDVVTLKLDHKYWPAYELRLTEAGWHRYALTGSAATVAAGMPERIEQSPQPR